MSVGTTQHSANTAVRYIQYDGRCKHIERRDAWTTTFCIVASNIWAYSVRNLLRFTLLAPKISRCPPEFWKICVTLNKTAKNCQCAEFRYLLLFICWLLCTVLKEVVQLYLFTNVQLYCCTGVLLYWCTDVQLYCCTDVLLYWCTVVLMYCCTGVLMYSCTVLLMYCCTGVLLYSCTGVLFYCCTFLMLYCFIVVLLYCCTSVWCSAASQRDPRTIQERNCKTCSTKHTRNKPHSIIHIKRTKLTQWHMLPISITAQCLRNILITVQ